MLDRQGAGAQTHPIELFTEHVVVQGTVTLPFRRVTEILNSAERDFVTVDGGTIAPLVHPAQLSGPNRVPTLVRRVQIRYAATYTDPHRVKPPGVEFAAVQKVPTACYGFLGPFVFHAHLHMRAGSVLFDFLQLGGDQFLPLTQATVYLVDHPDLPPRQHEVIIINRLFLDVMYLA
ncbi:MAG TPA: hypothetical protein VKY74_18135 [Chloroflexia bacterium]|nr:hypothetical protein [Chloroflexia bacterium]